MQPLWTLADYMQALRATDDLTVNSPYFYIVMDCRNLQTVPNGFLTVAREHFRNTPPNYRHTIAYGVSPFIAMIIRTLQMNPASRDAITVANSLEQAVDIIAEREGAAFGA